MPVHGFWLRAGCGPIFLFLTPEGSSPFFFPEVIPKLPNTSYEERRRKHARDGNIVLSWMRCFGGFRSSRWYGFERKNEIYNLGVVPEPPELKKKWKNRNTKKNHEKTNLVVLLENWFPPVWVRGRGDFIFHFILFALEVQESQIK